MKTMFTKIIPGTKIRLISQKPGPVMYSKHFHKSIDVPCPDKDCPICQAFASEKAIKEALAANGKHSRASKKIIRKARLAARRREGEQHRKHLATKIKERKELIEGIVEEVMGPEAREAP